MGVSVTFSVTVTLADCDDVDEARERLLDAVDALDVPTGDDDANDLVDALEVGLEDLTEAR